MKDLQIFPELPGLSVTVDRLVYRDASDLCPQRPHCFCYFIGIHNRSPLPFTLRGRKWVVTHSDGDVVIMEGDGVIGQTPTIEPGADFSYSSQHFINTPSATAEGSYLGLDSNGRRVVVRIPRFQMLVPIVS